MFCPLRVVLGGLQWLPTIATQDELSHRVSKMVAEGRRKILLGTAAAHAEVICTRRREQYGSHVVRQIARRRPSTQRPGALSGLVNAGTHLPVRASRVRLKKACRSCHAHPCGSKPKPAVETY